MIYNNDVSNLTYSAVFITYPGNLTILRAGRNPGGLINSAYNIIMSLERSVEKNHLAVNPRRTNAVLFCLVNKQITLPVDNNKLEFFQEI